MAHKLGPTGNYPLGKPLEPSDQGHIDNVFSIVPPRHGKLEFGTYLDWFFLTPPGARALTTTIRDELTAAYGRIRSETRLPIRVTADWERRVVMVDLPIVATELVATAEMWLGLMDQIDEACRRL